MANNVCALYKVHRRTVTASCKTIDWFSKKQDRFFLFIP